MQPWGRPGPRGARRAHGVDSSTAAGSVVDTLVVHTRHPRAGARARTPAWWVSVCVYVSVCVDFFDYFTSGEGKMKSTSA